MLLTKYYFVPNYTIHHYIRTLWSLYQALLLLLEDTFKKKNLETYQAVPNKSVYSLLSCSGPEQYTLAWNFISIHVRSVAYRGGFWGVQPPPQKF